MHSLLNTKKLCNLSEGYGENMVNLLTRMISMTDCMKTVWKVILFMEILW